MARGGCLNNRLQSGGIIGAALLVLVQGWFACHTNAMRRNALALALLAGIAAAGTAHTQPLVQTGPLSFAPLVRRVVPAVVNIAVRMNVADPSAAAVPPELM